MPSPADYPYWGEVTYDKSKGVPKQVFTDLTRAPKNNKDTTTHAQYVDWGTKKNTVFLTDIPVSVGMQEYEKSYPQAPKRQPSPGWQARAQNKVEEPGLLTRFTSAVPLLQVKAKKQGRLGYVGE